MKAVLAALMMILAPARAGSAQMFVASAQRADGSWPIVEHGGRPDAELRVHALLLLALVSEGSTSRRGPQRTVVKAAVRHLYALQDGRGRLLLRGDPDWLLDHALGSCALVEHARLAEARQRESWTPVLAAVAALREGIGRQPRGIGAELALWARWTAMALHRAAGTVGNADGRMADTLQGAAWQLRNTVALLPVVSPESQRDRAAAFLAAELGGSAVARLSAWPWPEEPLAEPLAAFYALLACGLDGPRAFRVASARVRRQIDGQQVSTPLELHGSFDPVGAFGAANGRFGTTASAFLTLSVYYRSSQLAILDG